MNNEGIRAALKKWRISRSAAELEHGPISTWDTQYVTDMSGLFQYRRDFNEDISGWNVANVTTTERMFYDAFSFNQPLEQWNVANVTIMQDMFNGARAFNQPLEQWSREYKYQCKSIVDSSV